MNRFLIALTLAIPCQGSLAQDWDNFSLRAHSSDRNEIENPALLQYTDANEASNSYSIDASLKYLSLQPIGSMDTSLGIEIHKNTLTDKEQDTQALNYFVDYQYRSSCDRKRTGNICIDTVDAGVTLEYQADEVAGTDSILTIIELVPSDDSLHMNGLGKEGSIEWYFAPSLGFEFENFRKTLTGATGTISRLHSNVELGWYPLKQSISDLSISVGYSHWRDMTKNRSLMITDNDHELAVASMKYKFPLPDGSPIEVYLNLDWVNGENPRTKLQDQEYIQFGLGIKL